MTHPKTKALAFTKCHAQRTCSDKARSDTTKAETPESGRERREKGRGGRQGGGQDGGRREEQKDKRRKKRGAQDRGQDRERTEGKETGGRSPRRDRSGPPTPTTSQAHNPKGARGDRDKKNRNKNDID